MRLDCDDSWMRKKDIIIISGKTFGEIYLHKITELDDDRLLTRFTVDLGVSEDTRPKNQGKVLKSISNTRFPNKVIQVFTYRSQTQGNKINKMVMRTTSLSWWKGGMIEGLTSCTFPPMEGKELERYSCNGASPTLLHEMMHIFSIVGTQRQYLASRP